MKTGDLRITMEIEPLVKLTCLENACRFNRERYGSLTCNLKALRMGPGAHCMDFREREPSNAGTKPQ